VSAAELVADPFDLDRIEGIAARLDLRQPNREALESIVFEIGQHYVIDREPPPFEAIVDSATGVGKTYILAAAIEYLAADGCLFLLKPRYRPNHTATRHGVYA